MGENSVSISNIFLLLMNLCTYEMVLKTSAFFDVFLYERDCFICFILKSTARSYFTTCTACGYFYLDPVWVFYVGG